MTNSQGLFLHIEPDLKKNSKQVTIVEGTYLRLQTVFMIAQLIFHRYCADIESCHQRTAFGVPQVV